VGLGSKLTVPSHLEGMGDKQQGLGALLRMQYCLVCVLLCSPNWPQTHDHPASAPGVLRLQVCTTSLTCDTCLDHQTDYQSWSDTEEEKGVFSVKESRLPMANPQCSLSCWGSLVAWLCSLPVLEHAVFGLHWKSIPASTCLPLSILRVQSSNEQHTVSRTVAADRG
jgi:hypothetical protein